MSSSVVGMVWVENNHDNDQGCCKNAVLLLFCEGSKIELREVEVMEAGRPFGVCHGIWTFSLYSTVRICRGT